MNKSIFLNISAAILIAVFTYASLSKLADFHNFHRQLFMSPLLSHYAGFIAWFIPMVELIIAGFLYSMQFRRLGFYLSFSLMILFTAYIFYILNYSSEVPCTCGGLLQHMGWKVHFIFNTLLISLSALSILLYSRRDIGMER